MVDRRNAEVNREKLKLTAEHDFADAILILPTYDDVTLAEEKSGSLLYATGEGPSTEGVYRYEDGVGPVAVGGGSGGGASDLSGLTIDTSKDWGGFSITNFGSLNGVTVESHSARHESGGNDELNVTDLSGSLADPQPPQDHADSHMDGGGDEIDAAELAAALGSDGEVLTSDGEGASWSSPPDSRVDVESDGSAVLSDATAINFATNLDVTDDGDGSVTVDANDQDTRVDVEDSGTAVVSNVSVLDFTGDVSATDQGNGEVAINVTNYTDEAAQDAVGTILDGGQFTYDDAAGTITIAPHAGTGDAHHDKTTDMDDLGDVQGIVAFDMDALSERPASGQADRVFFAEDGGVYRDTGSGWDEISNVYTDSDAVDAINSETTLSVDISGDSETIDGYEGADLGVLDEAESVTGEWEFSVAPTIAESGTTDVSENVEFETSNNTNPEIRAEFDSFKVRSGDGIRVRGDSHTFAHIRPDSAGDSGVLLYDETGSGQGRFVFNSSQNSLQLLDDANDNSILRYDLDQAHTYHRNVRQIDGKTSVIVDIDSNDSSSGEEFKVSHNSNSEALFAVAEDGTTNATIGPLEVGGNPVVSSSTGTAYDIQKDGTDGAGIINFKTE